MVLNEEQWIKELREKRIAYGISQGRLAVASGITREYLNKIESGKMKPSKELLETLHKELARFNPEAPLTMLFDYVKIRFPTLNIQHIIKDILKLNINYMLHEDYGHYSYTEHYSLGDIFIYTSADEENSIAVGLLPAMVHWWLFGVWIIGLIVLFSVLVKSYTGVLLGTGGSVLGVYLISFFPKAWKYTPTTLMESASLLIGTKSIEDYGIAVLITILLVVICLIVSITVMNRKQL